MAKQTLEDVINSESLIELYANKLKSIVSDFDTKTFLGTLSSLMSCIANGVAQEELGKLTSPMRQIYYLAALHVSSSSTNQTQMTVYQLERWNEIVELLNSIEEEYINLFFSDENDTVDEEWVRKRNVSMPTFLNYFSQGPLNYEEQTISFISDTYSGMDSDIEREAGLTTSDFLKFYDAVDCWCQNNFRMFTMTDQEHFPLRANWKEYTSVNFSEECPEDLRGYFFKELPRLTFVSDYGMKNRFRVTDLVNSGLPVEKAKKILSLLSITRNESSFLYYATLNPLFEKPIIKVSEDIFQVFEEKQVLHSIDNLLDDICTKVNVTKYNKVKGRVLESKIESLCRKFFGKKAWIFNGFYVDECEQDILVLWNGYAISIEAKNYRNKEPFRNPDKAFNRIKQEFDGSIGYAYKQCNRLENYFVNRTSFSIKDEKGNVVYDVDSQNYEFFSIIVTRKNYGQIQTDLSYLLSLEDDSSYPWAVKYDDFEVFILTLIQQKLKPNKFINFLCFREYLHGHLFCSDELEICGGFLSGDISQEMAENEDLIIQTSPQMAQMFDNQYRKGMGFRNEKFWKEKREGKTLFWG